ncbi:hypothetical protein RO3G_09670 [Rhizopus delemar RA 99-880]|uniref:Protein MIS12 homolog n=2 Tax=Rhizopus TaxID=4842 RepID=I1C930_RHIO9|nr:hypothetical protein RO3G_09670 [Rhizopus delemar RA 99-880]KAG1543465.1 hypothetical protein G6F51_006659 [Rhizopus arrhizus]|eukprot:EIE84960.1 hypothetical protein RO3G_09670 [Rhizopus delemar RA 99-880]
MLQPREYHELELLTEILGFLPKKFLDEIYDNMNIIIYNVIEGVNERLEEMHKDKAILIFDQFKTYERELETILDKVFNRFQQYLYDEVWKLPDHLDIRLYNDANGMNISEETENYLNEHVEILKKKTQAQRLLNMRLKRELQSIEYQRRSYDDYRQLTSILKEAAEKRNILNLEETMTHIRYQLDELKGLLDKVLVTMDELKRKEEPDPKILRLRENIRGILNSLPANH